MRLQSTQNKNNFIILATPAPISHRTAEENLGLGYLSAILQSKGYDVKILDACLSKWTPEELAQKILNEPAPLFVGISAYQSNIDQAVKTLEAVKKIKDIKFVAGGFGPTFNPDLFLDNGFDYIIRGEGENAICDLAAALQKGDTVENIKGLGYVQGSQNKHNEITKISYCLDDLPFPVRDTMQMAINKRTPVHLLTARGCTGHCSFCSINSFFNLSHTSKWRGRSIENIISEMKYLKTLGVEHIKIIDDSFVDGPRDTEWCQEFAHQMKQNNLSFYLRGSIRADKVNDETLRALKQAGFFSFSCGVENFSASALKRMAKGASVKQNCMALDLFKNATDVSFVKKGNIIHVTYLLSKRPHEFDYDTEKGVIKNER